MRESDRSAIEKAVSQINRVVAQDILEAGENNLSMGFLSTSFSTAIYGYAQNTPTPVLLAILGDEAARDMPVEAGVIDTKDVGTVITSTVCAVLTNRLRPKMIEMCRRIHDDKTLDTLSAAAALLDRASLENDPSFDLVTIRDIAAFAHKACIEGLSEDCAPQLAVLSATVADLAERRRDKALMGRLGETVERVARLANRLSDLAHLAELDPHGLTVSVGEEIRARSRSPITMAA